jgi:hypothetical protein
MIGTEGRFLSKGLRRGVGYIDHNHADLWLVRCSAVSFLEDLDLETSWSSDTISSLRRSRRETPKEVEGLVYGQVLYDCLDMFSY